MNTYKEIAKKYDLGKIETARFIAYMTMRWEEQEYIICTSGYSDEWAERFYTGVEYQASDLEGLKVLRTIDTCENCHERLTTDDFLEAINTGLKLGEVACDHCYMDFLKTSGEEQKNPDNKGG